MPDSPSFWGVILPPPQPQRYQRGGVWQRETHTPTAGIWHPVGGLWNRTSAITEEREGQFPASTISGTFRMITCRQARQQIICGDSSLLAKFCLISAFL